MTEIRVGTTATCRYCGQEIIYEPWFRDGRGPNPPVWSHTHSGTKSCSTRPVGWSADDWPFATPASRDGEEPAGVRDAARQAAGQQSCDVEFVDGSQCAKPAGHRPPGSDDPHDPTTADDPTQLRWGLNDVLYGDDDTITVCFSGPDREPYWLELTPDQAAVLRADLAGPDTPAVGGQDAGQPADRAAAYAEAADKVALELTPTGNAPLGYLHAIRDTVRLLRRMADEASTP